MVEKALQCKKIQLAKKDLSRVHHLVAHLFGTHARSIIPSLLLVSERGGCQCFGVCRRQLLQAAINTAGYSAHAGQAVVQNGLFSTGGLLSEQVVVQVDDLDVLAERYHLHNCLHDGHFARSEQHAA